jgi:hypothetical protein
MKTVYFVVYEAWEKGKSIGKGECEYFAPKPFTEISDIHQACKDIKVDLPFKETVQIQILNYIYLRKGEMSK